FMFLGGTNFVLSYFGFTFKFKKIFKNEEFRVYALLVIGFTLITTLVIIFQADPSYDSIDHPMIWGPTESAFRHAFLSVVSVITTTGFVSADYTAWTPFITFLFLGIMF